VDWKERNVAAKARQQAGGTPALSQSPTQAPAKAVQTPNPAKAAGPSAGTANTSPSATAVKQEPPGPINKEQKKELQRQQRLFQQLEEKIATLTRERSRLEASLSDPGTYSDRNKFVQAEADYKKASEELGKANKEYETIFEKIMELEKNQ
jgi:ATP-binding cassette subfamily F protein 3